MADVIVGVSKVRGVVAIVLTWSDQDEPCEAVSPNGTACFKPREGHNEWHVGFPEGEFGMPRKWLSLG